MLLANPEAIDARVKTVLQLLESRHHAPARMADFARAVNLSHCQMTRLVSAAICKAPNQIRTQIRFERARDLLQYTYLTVKQVMTAVGINDKSRFSRDFKKAFGLSPREFRNRYGLGAHGLGSHEGENSAPQLGESVRVFSTALPTERSNQARV